MNNFEAIKNMSVDEFARFLATIFGQGEIYGELYRSDYMGDETISGKRAFNDVGKAFVGKYKKFLEAECKSDSVLVPNIKY